MESPPETGSSDTSSDRQVKVLHATKVDTSKEKGNATPEGNLNHSTWLLSPGPNVSPDGMLEYVIIRIHTRPFDECTKIRCVLDVYGDGHFYICHFTQEAREYESKKPVLYGEGKPLFFPFYIELPNLEKWKEVVLKAMVAVEGLGPNKDNYSNLPCEALRMTVLPKCDKGSILGLEQ